MRAAFGLGGLLVTIGVIVLILNYAYLPHTQQVLKSGTTARNQAEQVAGVDANAGGRVTSQAEFAPVQGGNRLMGLKLTSITPGSSYQSYYGLAVNDVIDQIGPQMVRDIGDFEMAKAMAFEAYQRQWDLGINRRNQHFVLPSQKELAAGSTPPPATPAIQMAQPAPVPAPAPAPQTANPAPAAPAAPQPIPDTRNPLHRQLDAITGPR